MYASNSGYVTSTRPELVDGDAYTLPIALRRAAGHASAPLAATPVAITRGGGGACVTHSQPKRSPNASSRMLYDICFALTESTKVTIHAGKLHHCGRRVDVGERIIIKRRIVRVRVRTHVFVLGHIFIEVRFVCRR